MVTTASMAEVASLVGEPARAAMLQALMDGRALTASELAAAAGVTPQTASGHLGRLTEAGLVACARQGRHRYHRLATAEVARLLEALMLVAAGAVPARPRTGPREEPLRRARTCYDHIAGRLGVALADGMAAQGWIVAAEEAATVTAIGQARLEGLGIDLSTGPRGRMPVCRLCLDWSERRPHVAGRLGAALCTHALARGWVRKIEGTRALEVSPEGARVFREVFRAEAVVPAVVA